MHECEECKYFDLHPFVRDGDWTNFCEKSDKSIDELGNPGDSCEDFVLIGDGDR